MSTLLIADDDPIVRAMVVELLTSNTCAVEEAEDGVQAVERIKAGGIDLLIVDMLMPNMDGLETILALRNGGFDIPIVAITSGGRMDRSTLLRPAMAFGANTTLAKPLMREQLISTVDQALAKVAA